MVRRLPVTRFGLMRHGETRWNRGKRIQGQSDSPLTEEGLAAVAQWGQWFKTLSWSRLLASDLGRAQETARIINAQLKLPQTTDARLREQDWGQWTSRTIVDLRQNETEQLRRMEAQGWQFCPPGGEPREAVWRRSHQAFVDAAHRWPGQTILVIAHGGVIKCLLYRLLRRRFLPTEAPVLLPRALHWLHFDDEGLKIEKRNAMDLNTTKLKKSPTG